MKDVFQDIFDQDQDPKDLTPNQVRQIIAHQLLQLSSALKAYGELVQKNAPKPRPQHGR